MSIFLPSSSSPVISSDRSIVRSFRSTSMSMTKNPRTTRCSMSSMLIAALGHVGGELRDDALLVFPQDADDGEDRLLGHCGVS